MSTYGTATVIVRTWSANQAFRASLESALPSCLQEALPDTLARDGLTDLLSTAVSGGQITPVEAAHARALVGQAQREDVSRAAAESLAALGFQTRVDVGDVTGILAERGHQVMAIEVHDGGGYAFDIAGIEGPGCQSVIADFTTEMTRRGIHAEQTVHPHNDPRGGQLMRRVSGQTRRGAAKGSTRGRASRQ